MQQQRTGGAPPCDPWWICRFVEEWNNITQLENIVVGWLVHPAGFQWEVSANSGSEKLPLPKF